MARDKLLDRKMGFTAAAVTLREAKLRQAPPRTLTKVVKREAPAKRPRRTLAGCPALLQKACKHGETKQGLHGSARGEPSAIDTAAARRRAKPAAELKTNESAQSYPGAHDVQRRMQRGKRLRLDADRPLACRAGCQGAASISD